MATTVVEIEKQSFTCTATGKVVNAARMPSGWKMIGGDVLSPTGVKERYRIGAVSIAVRFSDDKEWNDRLNATLNRGFALSTSLANWFATELYARDTKRTPDLDKLPSMKVDGLYMVAQQRFPLSVAPSKLLSAMEHRIRGVYSAVRYDILWTGRRSLPSFRYPYPYPCKNDDWRIFEDESGAMFVSVNIARERITLPLSISHKYERQRVGLRKIMAGNGRFGELVINRASDGKVFCRIVGYFPRERNDLLTGILRVKSDTDSLIVALNLKDERLWIYNGDQVRRWVHEHRRKLQRWSEDTKHEDRPRPGFAERRTAAVNKYRDRMASVTHQIAARIVNYAKRRKFEKIELDLSEKSFVDRFPWHELEAKVRDKAGKFGIQVELTGK